MAEPSATCTTCGGDGWYADHDDLCYAEGECCSPNCPIQRPCHCMTREMGVLPDPDHLFDQEPF